MVALVAAGVVGGLERRRFETDRLELLQLEAVRTAIEVESLSLNGPLMGAMRAATNARLREFADRQQASADFRNALLALANRMQHCDSLEALAREVLGEARASFGALQGALYVLPQDGASVLVLAGSSACATPPPSRIGFGEGLLV